MELDNYKHLLSRLGTICKHHKEISRLSGANFNVFKIVKVTEDEVRHSAFLAELLNPQGLHGQGDLFLRLFIKILAIENFSCETAIVEVEKYIGPINDNDLTGGFIDIFIDDKNGNTITIENKIYANDQPKQLIRYHNFKQQHLHYLTLDGRRAGEISTFNEKHGKPLNCPEHYQVISYKYHILKWLDLCQKEAVSMPLLREGIAHYINLIKFLTGESTNKAMSQEIVNLLTESPASLSNANELVNNYTKAKIKLQWEFWNFLKNKLSDNGITIIENDKTVTYEKVKNFYQKKENPYGLWSLIYFKGEISFHWCCEIYDSIHFGFTIEKNGKGGISDSYENEKYRKLLKEYDHNYESSQWFLGKQNTHPQLNFKAFNSDDIFNLANKAELEKTVQQIADKAYNDISFLRVKFKELEGAANQ